MPRIQFFSTDRIEMAKEEGTYNRWPNCPSCILSLEKGLELMRESGEPMEFGIFDFSRCSQGLLVRRRRMGQGGVRMEGDGMKSPRPTHTRTEVQGIPASFHHLWTLLFLSTLKTKRLSHIYAEYTIIAAICNCKKRDSSEIKSMWYQPGHAVLFR